ncbi:MAG: hypothetical protein Q4A35_04140 [Candidatus Gracilibacteria bacterium]|nr:hypothetical protein [Candidatus Gracilibacteria bacterium]
MMSKAQIVVDTYDEMRANGESYYTRYDKALSAAEYQGGIEICNSNNMPASCILFAPNLVFKFPNRIFKFDDDSYVNVTYGGAGILTKEDLDVKSGVFSYAKGSISASFFVFQFL